MSFRLSTASKLLHRPHLITPQAAEYWAGRMLEIDAAALRRPSRFDALARKLGLGKDRARASDDDDSEASPPPTRPVAYAPMWMGEPDKQLDWGWSVKDGVAMMAIEGPLVEHGGYGLCDFMHGYDTIAAAIDEFDADSSAKGGIIHMDTPGGPVASGIYELAAKIQARGPDAKPIWVVCEMACSAGYWIASQFDRVIAAPAGILGSIGVVMVHVNQAGALEKAGIEVTSIEAPEEGFKTDGASWKALSPEGRAALQSDINELMTAFAETVEKGRGPKLTAEKAKALRAQVFPGTHADKSRDAVALGLADSVMSEQQAFEALRAEVNASNIIPIRAAAKAGVTAAPAASMPAKAGATTETDMTKREQRVAAVMAGKTSAKTDKEKLDEIQTILDSEEEETGDESAEADEDEPAAETDEDDEDQPAAVAPKRKAAVVDPAVAQAVLALPEAVGREKLANRLAFKPGMTVEEAKADLSAAPRKSAFTDRVADPGLSANGGPALTPAQKDHAAAFAAAGVPMRKRG